jgi:multidrug efflux pump
MTEADVAFGAALHVEAIWIASGDNNIFTQIGLMVLMGLASKNAVLIVEFASRVAPRDRM